jgi:hypothetical protein
VSGRPDSRGDAPEEPVNAGRREAFARAVAAGRDELFGCDQDDPTGLFTADDVLPASLDLRDRLTRLVQEAERLSAAAATAEERLADVAALVNSRLEAWAAFVGIDRRVRDLDAHDRGSEPPAGNALDAVLDAIDACDAAMEAVEPMLVRLYQEGRFRHWLDRLAPPHRELPPWWLRPA